MATACAASPGTIPLKDDGSLASPFALPDKGAISISRMKMGQLHVYISPEFRVTGRAITDDQVAVMAIDLANIVDSTACWSVTENSRRSGGAYLVTLEAA